MLERMDKFISSEALYAASLSNELMAAITRSSTSSAFWEARTNPVDVENNDALKFPFSFNSLSTSSSRLTTVNKP